MKKMLFAAILFLFIFITIGCATIVGSPHQVIPLATTPSEAAVSITDESGAQVFKGTTPTTATLLKSTGKYWGKKSYAVQITKPGHESQTVNVTGTPNGWYIGGNILFGGLIGWFLVDPWNGHMYNLEPENINATLSATKAESKVPIMGIDNLPAVNVRPKTRGIRLQNGTIIEGEILQMNTEVIKIRTAGGDIVSYPFDKVESFLK